MTTKDSNINMTTKENSRLVRKVPLFYYWKGSRETAVLSRAVDPAAGTSRFCLRSTLSMPGKKNNFLSTIFYCFFLLWTEKVEKYFPKSRNFVEKSGPVLQKTTALALNFSRNSFLYFWQGSAAPGLDSKDGLQPVQLWRAQHCTNSNKASCNSCTNSNNSCNHSCNNCNSSSVT